MDGRQTGLSFGGLLGFVGAMLIAIASFLRWSANAAEAQCRAVNDGLDELSCMNFEDIRFYVMVSWGIGFLVVGLLTALLSWLWPRPRAVAG